MLVIDIFGQGKPGKKKTPSPATLSTILRGGDHLKGENVDMFIIDPSLRGQIKSIAECFHPTVKTLVITENFTLKMDMLKHVSKRPNILVLDASPSCAFLPDCLVLANLEAFLTTELKDIRGEFFTSPQSGVNVILSQKKFNLAFETLPENSVFTNPNSAFLFINEELRITTGLGLKLPGTEDEGLKVY